MGTDGLHFDGAVFDLDGVITFTASAHAMSWKRMFDGFLQRRSDLTGEAFVPFDGGADYLAYVDGRPRIDGVKSFLASRGIELPDGAPDDAPGDATAWSLGNRKNRAFQDVLESEGVKVDADAVAFVRALRERGLRVAVASSSKNCGPVLDRAGLSKLFEARVDGVVSAELGLAGKPSPDIFIEAAERIGISPARSVVFEDAISGVQAGRAGGFGLVVGIDRLGVAVDLRAHGADVIFRGFDETSLATVSAWFAERRERRPAVLGDWGRFEKRLAGKHVALFLDYDGTLTPIVSRPELAILQDVERDVLRRLARAFPTAIISGRGRDDVEGLVGLKELAYAGSHGFDIVGPGGAAVDHQVAEWIEPTMRSLAEDLEPVLGGIEGTVLEPKRYSVAVHYRLVSEQDFPRVERLVDDIIGADVRLKKAHGKEGVRDSAGHRLGQGKGAPVPP